MRAGGGGWGCVAPLNSRRSAAMCVHQRVAAAAAPVPRRKQPVHVAHSNHSMSGVPLPVITDSVQQPLANQVQLEAGSSSSVPNTVVSVQTEGVTSAASPPPLHNNTVLNNPLVTEHGGDVPAAEAQLTRLIRSALDVTSLAALLRAHRPLLNAKHVCALLTRTKQLMNPGRKFRQQRRTTTTRHPTVMREVGGWVVVVL